MTETPHAERAHALCSASSSARWLQCPGSVALSLGIKTESSEHAEEGTRAHELAEKILRKWLEKPDWNLEEKWLNSLGAETEMLEHVMTFVSACQDKYRELDKPVARVEQRFTLNQDLQMFGTVDFVATGIRRSVTVGVVVDLKYGMGVPVKAEGNSQLAYYAAALVANSKKPLEAVDVVIVQPRLEEWMTETQLSRRQVEEWHGVFVRGAEKALQQVLTKKYELKAGSHCRWCPALPTCGEHERHLAERAALDFRENDLTLPAPESLSPERISRLLAVKGEIEKFLDAVFNHAVKEARAGGKVPGWKLVEGKSSRTWKDEVEAAKGLQALGIKDPYDRTLRGITSIERELGKGKIDHLTVKPPGKPTLAPEDDKRPALSVGAEFDDGKV